jgi:hypothetical protein
MSDADRTTPTEEGFRRHAGGGYFVDDGVDPPIQAPCTCSPGCLHPCDGACGCSACRCYWLALLDDSGFSNGEALRKFLARQQDEAVAIPGPAQDYASLSFLS